MPRTDEATFTAADGRTATLALPDCASHFQAYRLASAVRDRIERERPTWAPVSVSVYSIPETA